MAKPERFEDLEAWQKAWEMTRAIYDATSKGELGLDMLHNQMRDVATGIMIHISQGFEHEDEKEFQQHLIAAKELTGELKTYLYIAKDQVLICEMEFDVLYKLATETGLSIKTQLKSIQPQNKSITNSDYESRIRGYLK